jgi:ABC-type nitrate/sulfonate/bicarbonate transport system substrate-binding protein
VRVATVRTPARRGAGIGPLMLTVLLMLTACGVFGNDEAAPPPPERTTLRIGVGNPIATAPLRMAVAEGRFAEAGLTVELVEQATQNAALAQLAAGELDIAFATDVALFQAAASDVPLQLQGEAYTAGARSMALMTLPGSDYADPADRASPDIAVDTADGLGALTTRSVLATAGLDPGEIRFTEAPQEAMPQALRNGLVDAAWMVEPYITMAATELGAVVLADCAQGATQDFPMYAYASARRFAEANPRTMQLFRTVLGQAQQSDTASIRRSLPDLTELDETTAALVSIGTYPVSLNSIRLQRVADLMHSSGMLPRRLDVQALLPDTASR